MPGSEHLGHQAVDGERGDQLAIDPARFAPVRDRCEDVSRQRLAPRQQVAVSVGEVRIGGAQGMTATPTSSTSALGSKSPATPSTAIAGYLRPKWVRQTLPSSPRDDRYAGRSVT